MFKTGSQKTLSDNVLKAVPEFIEAVYSEKRIHSFLGYFSHEEFKKLAERKQLQQHGLQPVMIVPENLSNGWHAFHKTKSEH